MTHHQYGNLVADTNNVTAMVEMTSPILLLRESSTVALDTISQGESVPAVALALSGRINKTQDTVGTVWVISPMDAGNLAGMLMDACARIGPEPMKDFEVGYRLGAAGKGVDDG